MKIPVLPRLICECFAPLTVFSESEVDGTQGCAGFIVEEEEILRLHVTHDDTPTVTLCDRLQNISYDFCRACVCSSYQ